MKLSLWNDHTEWCSRAVESGDGSGDPDDGEPELVGSWERFSLTVKTAPETEVSPNG